MLETRQTDARALASCVRILVTQQYAHPSVALGYLSTVYIYIFLSRKNGMKSDGFCSHDAVTKKVSST